MSLFPLVERELRVALRRPTAKRVRSGAAGGAMVFAVWGYWVWSSWIAGSQVGYSLFRMLAEIAFVGSLGAGIVLTADAISRERREGTLGLLFLTDLKPGDVILGKMAAKAVLPFYAVLALVPTMAVFTATGGVTAGELLRTLLAIANALFVSLAVALCTSTLCVQQRLAHALAFLAIAFLAGGATFLRIAPCDLTMPFLQANGRSFEAAPRVFIASLAGTHVVGWMALVASCWWINTGWRNRNSRHSRVTAAARMWRWVPNTLHPAFSRVCQLGNPIARLGGLDPSRGRAVWVLPIAGLLSWGCISLMRGNPTRAAAEFGWVIGSHLLLRIWVAMDACHALGEFRNNGTLEVLLGTPLSAREITGGMAAALRRRFLWPALLHLGIGFWAAARCFAHGNHLAGVAALVLGATLLIDLECVGWVGLWRGLTGLGSSSAIIATIVQALGLPLGWVMILRGLFIRSSSAELAGLYVALGILSVLLLRASARSRLFEHFRRLALRPYGAKIPHIESKWSPINWEVEREPSEPMPATER